MTQCVIMGTMAKQSYIDTFETKTGILVRVRPLSIDDAPFLVDLFEHMSSESRYNRFMQSVDNVDIDRVWSEAERIALLTNGESYGIIAFADTPNRSDTPVGAARFVKITSQQAEIAVSVRDDMQQLGIGTHLMRLLIQLAAEQGIDQLFGTIQNSNAPMWAMLKKLGLRLARQSEGSYSIVTIHINETASHLEDWLDTAADYSPEPQIIW